MNLCTGQPIPPLNVRDGPWGNKIGLFTSDNVQTLRFTARDQDTQGAWWYAFWWDELTVGWIHGAYIDWLDQSQCESLSPAPVRTFATGPHLIAPANENAMWGDYAACRNGTERLCYMLKAQNPEAIITFRSLTVCGLQTDGPEEWQWYSASAYAACVYQDSPDGFDYYEVINERYPPNDDWDLFVDWHAEVCAYFNAHGRRCAAFSFAPGNPPYFETWETLWRWIDWANTHPLPDGSYNAIAWHSAGYAAPGVSIPPEDQWQVSNVWIAGRDVLLNVWLHNNLGVSLTDFRGPVFITELYFGDHWSCADLAASIVHTQAVLDQREWLQAGAVWNFGGNGITWVNHTNCRDTIALSYVR